MICETHRNRSGVGCDPDPLPVVHRSLLRYSLQRILPRRARRPAACIAWDERSEPQLYPSYVVFRSSSPRGGGVSNDDLLTLSNSTISGNTAADRGGGIDNTSTATFNNITALRNASGRVAGGLFNTGTVTYLVPAEPRWGNRTAWRNPTPAGETHQAGQATRAGDQEKAPEGRARHPGDRRHRHQHPGHDQQDGRHDQAQTRTGRRQGRTAVRPSSARSSPWEPV
jgi:hypothetical protein